MLITTLGRELSRGYDELFLLLDKKWTGIELVTVNLIHRTVALTWFDSQVTGYKLGAELATSKGGFSEDS